MNFILIAFRVGVYVSLVAVAFAACRTLASIERTADEARQAIEQSQSAIRRIEQKLPAMINEQMNLVRHDLFQRVDSALDKVDRQIDLARDDLTRLIDHHSEAIRADTLSEVHLALGTANGHIGNATAALREFSSAYATIPTKVEVALKPWMNCAGNGACWPAQFTAALGATRQTLGETSRTMKAIREGTPSIVANVDRTTDNVERITRPDSWLVRGLKIAGPAAAAAIVTANK